MLDRSQRIKDYYSHHRALFLLSCPRIYPKTAIIISPVWLVPTISASLFVLFFTTYHLFPLSFRFGLRTRATPRRVSQYYIATFALSARAHHPPVTIITRFPHVMGDVALAELFFFFASRRGVWSINFIWNWSRGTFIVWFFSFCRTCCHTISMQSPGTVQHYVALFI